MLDLRLPLVDFATPTQIEFIPKKLQDDPAIQILNVRGYGFKLVC
jgi:hypothetical protein